MALSICGCTQHADLLSQSRPFAQLYGIGQAHWLENNQAAIFSDGGGPLSREDLEVRGFKQLDLQNQKLYLVVRFCTHQPGNAAGGSQIWRLMGELKCTPAELFSYMQSLNKEALERYAAYLRGTTTQFYHNTRHYCHE